jgi:hypothetical protein
MEQIEADKQFLFSFFGCIFLLETFLRKHFHGRNPKVIEVFLDAGGAKSRFFVNRLYQQDMCGFAFSLALISSWRSQRNRKKS